MVVFSEEVKRAKLENNAIVALESTIISHGMPYPQNVKTALQVEEIVRKNGAVPATIAIINGTLRAGLNADEIEAFGKLGKEAIKASRRDIPILQAQRKNGATTVAATMIVAQMAGISIFATGGIGGVHREATKSFDISADLQELARTNVAVVCAGAKSILDLELTLEYLETFGVPVIGFKTDEFPAFYTQKSGLKVDYCINSELEIASIMHNKWLSPELNGGLVIANPIPDVYSLDKTNVDRTIELALERAKHLGIKGKSVTPFLLSEIESRTNSRSLEANIALILNNAALAAKIAVEYQKLK